MKFVDILIQVFIKGKNILIETLAEQAHESWSGWMRYLFTNSIQNDDGSITIPEHLVKRWKRQMYTRYNDLPENEKYSDRNEANKIIDKIKLFMEIKND